MAYIEVRTTLPDHRKAKAAARLLGVPRAQLIGHLVCLWAWALDNVGSDGALIGVSAMDIAQAAGWPAKQSRTAERFVTDLTKTGWIDDEDGELFIHDWADYAGRLLSQREADAARKRAERASVRAQHRTTSAGQSAGRPADGETSVRRTSGRAGAPARAPSHRTAPTPRPEKKTGVSGEGSGENPSAAAGAQPKPPTRRAARPPLLDIGPEDDRYPVAEVLSRRYRYHEVSDEQWEVLWEEADNEWPLGTGGFLTRDRVWRRLARWLAEVPKDAGDPISALLARQRRVKAERLAAADATEELQEQAKAAERTAAAASPIAQRLAGRIGPPANGHAPSIDHDAAVGMLRQLRGTVDAPGWRRLLERYGVSEAELEATG